MSIIASISFSMMLLVTARSMLMIARLMSLSSAIVLRTYVFMRRSPLNERSAEQDAAGIAASIQATFQNVGRTLSRSLIIMHVFDKISCVINFQFFSMVINVIQKVNKYLLLVVKQIDVHAVLLCNYLEAVFVWRSVQDHVFQCAKYILFILVKSCVQLSCHRVFA
jgi:hypothetical protein